MLKFILNEEVNMNTTIHTESWFTKRFMFSMVIFLLLLAVQTFTIELVELSRWQLIIVTLMPMVALIWAFFIYKARYHSLDEYMQRLTGEAFLWVIGIVCFVTSGYGLLAMKMPMPEVSFAYILPAVFGGQGLILHLLLMGNNSEE
ncbi:MAG: hypothetical protein ACI9IA_001182 [Enterobacterales bacterium]|jgi:hypothetical protein